MSYFSWWSTKCNTYNETTGFYILLSTNEIGNKIISIYLKFESIHFTIKILISEFNSVYNVTSFKILNNMTLDASLDF